MKRKSHWSVRFEKRAAPPWYIRALNPVICILLAFVCCAALKSQGKRAAKKEAPARSGRTAVEEEALRLADTVCGKR